MGGGVSGLHVDDNQKNPNYGIGFAKAMFTLKEWNSLKQFCNSHNIQQTDLNRIALKFLSSPEAQLRNMRVAISDFKLTFANQSLIIRECADVFIPQIFLKPVPEVLNPPYSLDEISFSRFIYLGYTFAAQPYQDLIYDFFSITKRNYALQIVTKIYSFNIQQISVLLTENLPKSTTLAYLQKRCNVRNDTEISLEDIMKLAMKYPLLFYPLVQYQKCFQRKFFGDQFWTSRPKLLSRFFDYEVYDSFESLEKAQKRSAQAIICDYRDKTPTSLIVERSPLYEETDQDDLSPRHLIESNYQISSEILRRMKADLGYRMTRRLVLESGYKWSKEDQHFMNLSIPDDHYEVADERIYDPKLRATFLMNYGSGLRAWVDIYRGRDGRILREETYHIDRSHLKKKELENSIEMVTESSQSRDGELEEVDMESESGHSQRSNPLTPSNHPPGNPSFSNGQGRLNKR